MAYINAHRKAILAAIGAILIWFVDEGTADAIIATVSTILLAIVPNDQVAVEQIYGTRYRDARDTRIAP